MYMYNPECPEFTAPIRISKLLHEWFAIEILKMGGFCLAVLNIYSFLWPRMAHTYKIQIQSMLRFEETPLR